MGKGVTSISDVAVALQKLHILNSLKITISNFVFCLKMIKIHRAHLGTKTICMLKYTGEKFMIPIVKFTQH